MVKMTAQEYDYMVKAYSPPSPYVKNMANSFLIGGAVCALGQVLMALYENLGMSQQNAGTTVSISLIFLSVLLTGLNLYDNIAKAAGAGTLVPITGFANSMASSALEFKSEGYILGLGAKMFIIAGPVLVYGLSSSIIYGLILYLFKLY